MRPALGTLGTLLLGAVVVACGSTAEPSAASGDSLVDAAAVQGELTAALADTLTPPGVVLRVSLAGQTGEFQPGYGRAMVQQAAICAWFRYWLTALATDDTDATTRAAAAADTFRSWDTYISADQSFRDVIDAATSKTRLGDPGPMRSFVTNNCPAA